MGLACGHVWGMDRQWMWGGPAHCGQHPPPLGRCLWKFQLSIAKQVDMHAYAFISLCL